jgi:hypothetical protein
VKSEGEILRFLFSLGFALKGETRASARVYICSTLTPSLTVGFPPFAPKLLNLFGFSCKAFFFFDGFSVLRGRFSAQSDRVSPLCGNVSAQRDRFSLQSDRSVRLQGKPVASPDKSVGLRGNVVGLPDKAVALSDNLVGSFNKSQQIVLIAFFSLAY